MNGKRFDGRGDAIGKRARSGSPSTNVRSRQKGLYAVCSRYHMTIGDQRGAAVDAIGRVHERREEGKVGRRESDSVQGDGDVSVDDARSGVRSCRIVAIVAIVASFRQA